MFAKILGTRASATLGGRGASQRSGFHSFASGPQIAGSRFDPSMLIQMVVPAGTKSSLMGLPSVPVIGSESGRTASSSELRVQRSRCGSQ